MNIAVLGAGAMGSLFSCYLSKRNTVYLIGHNPEKQKMLDEKGILLREKDGLETLYHPHAVSACSGLPEMDLVILFVRVMDTIEALEANRALIGQNTCLLTLQNGAGHEKRLLQYVDADHALIGSTRHGSCILEPGKVFHSGTGSTSVGFVSGRTDSSAVADELTVCGFPCTVSASIRKQIWEKLFINTSSSSLTAVLQVAQGFILEDPYAHSLMLKMAHEAVEVANAEGIAQFDEQAVIDSIHEVISNGIGGYTSIYTHVKTGQKSEVDYISGYVVERAKAHGIAVPCHEMVVTLIHALESRNARGI